ncbi:TetR/AcrR family transcriptional regulator [Pseudomonas sp.]|uniref:TetR/AcrR family transcriptional regulator n=1 Tax=Pseudomonas sp. TaxID=306 RepID=UPI0028A66B5C|nr:TetR/AcrR family transcriptional regulator [Pseudomonas sp.]
MPVPTPMPNATRKPAPQKRETYHVGNLAPQLLDAARQLLVEVGPTRLSLRAVSERVGVSPTAAYHHFANRTELVAHLAAQGFLELSQALSGDTSESDRLRQVCLAYFRFARSNPAIYQLMFGAEFVSGETLPALAEARAEAFGRLERIIADELAQPADCPDVRGAALGSWSYIHGFASLLIHGVIQVPEAVSDERLVELTLGGLRRVFQDRHGSAG